MTRDPSGSGAIFIGDPQFGQPVASPDPTKFTVAHGSDNQLYNLVKAGLLQKIPPPRTQNLTLPLASVWGSSGAARVAAVQKAGQIVFHVVGDSGSVKGPGTQSLVADKMVADFTDPSPADRPQFCFHLGDVVYSFGEAKFYYDQFYDPYCNYPAPIVAIPGNHDASCLQHRLRSVTDGVPRELRDRCADEVASVGRINSDYYDSASGVFRARRAADYDHWSV